MTKERWTIAVIVSVLILVIAGLSAVADTVFPPTDERLANIEGTLGIVYPTATSETTATATAIPPTATATSVPPTATPEPPTGNATEWHAATDHEHGDAPPQWVTDWSMQTFGHGVIYGGDEQTPNENAIKHNAFKGHIVPSAAGGQAYVRFHAQSNPHGRAAQYHSYELYYRDTAGNVSFFQGWMNFGHPDTPGARAPRSQGDSGVRPAMLVVDQAAWNAGIRTEQWYGKSPLAEFGININQTSTIWHPGEHNNEPHNQATWDPTGSFGTTRLVDFFLIRDRYQGFVGTLCTNVLQTQMLACGTEGAVEQVIASTFYADMRVQFGVQRISGQDTSSFSCGSCQLPN